MKDNIVYVRSSKKGKEACIVEKQRRGFVTKEFGSKDSDITDKDLNRIHGEKGKTFFDKKKALFYYQEYKNMFPDRSCFLYEVKDHTVRRDKESDFRTELCEKKRIGFLVSTPEGGRCE